MLLDDRKASPGVKFKDAELLGVPWIVVVGRGWADGVVELRNRFSGETREVAGRAGAGRRHRGGARGLALFGAAGEGDGDRPVAEHARSTARP